MESIVKVEHLSHRYTVDWAIQDINFEVNRKGILGLLGSNGAGKVHDDEHYLRRVESNGWHGVY